MGMPVLVQHCGGCAVLPGTIGTGDRSQCWGHFPYLPVQMGNVFCSEVSIALRSWSCGCCQASKNKDGNGCRAVTAAAHFLV